MRRLTSAYRLVTRGCGPKGITRGTRHPVASAAPVMQSRPSHPHPLGGHEEKS
jgi:hypothetical protein